MPRRKFYANLQGSVRSVSLAPDPCPKCGGRVAVQEIRHPAPYLIVPPYKRTPEAYMPRREFVSSWCEGCS